MKFKFNLKSPLKNSQKIKNTIALKRNIYALILSVIFIIGAVLLTVLATVLAERFPLNLDLTTDKKHSMTSDNIDYIKDIDKSVNIYVTLTEDEYSCESSSSYNMLYYAAQQSFLDYNSTNANYFKQTVELLHKYEQYNDNITVTFIDTAQPNANEITDDFKDYLWTAGDILVESKFEVDGKEIVRRTSIPFKEMYTLKEGHSDTANYANYFYNGYIENYALYGMGIGYIISENNFEYSMSSAIYKVTSESTPLFLVPKSYCDPEAVSAVLEGTLTANNFQIEYTEGLINDLLASDESKEKYSGIILADCSSDISTADRSAIETFLDNNGKKGKSLLFFADTNTYKLTNLCGLLGDWGIGADSGVLFETSQYHIISNNPTSMYLASLETDYTTSSDGISTKSYVATDMIPLKQIYTTSNTATYTRKTEVLMTTASSGTTAVMPVDADAATFKPASDGSTDTYPTIILTEDAKVGENSTYLTSHVIAFASSDFIGKDWTQYSSVANMNFTLDVFNAAAGITDNPFTFVAKTITNPSFLVNVTKADVIAIRIIFMGVIPIMLIIVGIIVFVRRRRR